MGLCPPITDKDGKSNFYLRSLAHTTPAQWYSIRVMGIHTIQKTVSQMLKDAKLDGYFTNHSLRRSSTTCLFQAGVNRKIVKEFTGHRSDAIDKYQITSDTQCEQLSKIISGKNPSETCQISVEPKEDAPEKTNSLEISVKNENSVNKLGCSCIRNNVNLNDTHGPGQLLHDILSGQKYGKAKIKLEIDLTD